MIDRRWKCEENFWFKFIFHSRKFFSRKWKKIKKFPFNAFPHIFEMNNFYECDRTWQQQNKILFSKTAASSQLSRDREKLLLWRSLWANKILGVKALDWVWKFYRFLMWEVKNFLAPLRWLTNSSSVVNEIFHSQVRVFIWKKFIRENFLTNLNLKFIQFINKDLCCLFKIF